MKKLKTKEAKNWLEDKKVPMTIDLGDSVIEVPDGRDTTIRFYAPIKYPAKRQIWFRRHENLLYAIGGVIVAGLCVFSYAYFQGVI